jgi:pilus assembly protein Flp/PilA
MSLPRSEPEDTRFGRADLGATAIEYALIAALISVFIVGAFAVTAGGISATYNTIINAINGVMGN